MFEFYEWKLLLKWSSLIFAIFSCELFVQPAWKFFPAMSQPLEMKVFVIWGKVFFMRFESGIADWGAGNARGSSFISVSWYIFWVDRFYVLPNVDLQIRDNTNALLKYGTGKIPLLSDIPNIEDHLRAVIKLAELDAQTLKADFFRVIYQNLLFFKYVIPSRKKSFLKRLKKHSRWYRYCQLRGREIFETVCANCFHCRPIYLWCFSHCLPP